MHVDKTKQIGLATRRGVVSFGRGIVVENSSHWGGARAEWVWRCAHRMVRAARADKWRVSIVLTTDERIRSLNREWRGIDSATDVLSFATVGDDLVRPGHLPPSRSAAALATTSVCRDGAAAWPDLGQIVISAPYVEATCDEWSEEDLDAALQRTIAHGLCHLLGFDHTTDRQHVLMQRAERALLGGGAAKTLD